MPKIRRVAGEESELCCRKRRDSPYRNVSSKPDSRRVVSSYYLSPWKQHMHPMIYFSPSERWKVQQWTNSPPPSPPSLCLFSCLRHCNATHNVNGSILWREEEGASLLLCYCVSACLTLPLSFSDSVSLSHPRGWVDSAVGSLLLPKKLQKREKRSDADGVTPLFAAAASLRDNEIHNREKNGGGKKKKKEKKNKGKLSVSAAAAAQ